MTGEFEAVIGLEVHCQLSTESKIFCACPVTTSADANSSVCPICAGHPGTLPTLNRKVVEYAIKAGLATHCSIRAGSVFARKSYFYPDLPKGYQITQYEKPICEDGWLGIETAGGARKIPIRRIHLEEDAGKSVHLPGYSLVNLNRAGVPLIEIVSGPDLATAEEAGAYLRALHAVVTYLGICDGNMQEGNFRCDANVSVRPRESRVLGTRVEVKNVNSFRFVEKAIEHEIARQTEVIRAGGRVVQETRGYDSARNATTVMRSKEEAMDYRYFPDPDLIPVQLADSWIEKIRGSLPELPEEKRKRFVSELGLGSYDASVLTSSRELAAFFESVVEAASGQNADPRAAAKPAANWVTGELTRLLNEQEGSLEQALARSRVRPGHIAEIVRLTLAGTISSTGAKQALLAAWETGDAIALIVEREGLRQVSDAQALDSAVEKVIASFPEQAAELRAGKEKLLGFFVGQAMKATGGKANPAMLQELIKRRLS